METCQSTGPQCLLDSSDPSSAKMTMPPHRCELGSVPGYFIQFRDADDVAAAFKISNETGVPLHDYEGRSSAPQSLALWMYHLKGMSYQSNFVSEGCSSAHPAAEVQWAEAYTFADAHSITLVGGSDRSIGAVDGCGGHTVPSNTMGLGADRVLQFKVVNPDGKLRVANASRSGGGGTFGVVMEATILAAQAVTLQAVVVSWSIPNRTLTKELWEILTDNGLRSAADGWGGFSMAETAILATPSLDTVQAAASMAPLIDFGLRLQHEGIEGAQLQVTTFLTFLSFFEAFSSKKVASVGTSIAVASCLALVARLLDTNDAGPGMIILLALPVVTDAWRSSVYHVTTVASWEWNATATEKRAAYHSASSAIDNLRRITPDAAYLNEADVYEPNHEVSFWGSHYEELLRIKQKYDPHRLLDCWHCIGWNPQSALLLVRASVAYIIAMPMEHPVLGKDVSEYEGEESAVPVLELGVTGVELVRDDEFPVGDVDDKPR
ncbi:hypothetical protein B0H11DRAFT_2163146 [Mycena galericulata]|nr:hypothetical protein B0H11DRAFT_2163146 [Mycena galericulata]